MPDAEQSVLKNNAEARASFAALHLAPYRTWYWASLNKIYRRYIACYWIGLCAGLSATVLAAAPQFSHGNTVIRWLVVITSAISTLVTGTLTPRYKRMLDDRDQGRIKLDLLSAKLGVEDYPASLHTEFKGIVDEIARIESVEGRLDRIQDDAKQKKGKSKGEMV